LKEQNDSVQRLIGDLDSLNDELLIILEEDLIGVRTLELCYRESENSKEDDEKDFLKELFEDFEDLKEILTATSMILEEILEGISWFFNTALFDLMYAEPENFAIKSIDTYIYKCMLNRIPISSKEIFEQHLKILLDIKTKEKELFDFYRFFCVLREAKQEGFSEVNRKRKSSAVVFFLKKKIKLTPSSLSINSNQLINSSNDDQETSINLTRNLTRPSL
jgi:hypothetical protein